MSLILPDYARLFDEVESMVPWPYSTGSLLSPTFHSGFSQVKAQVTLKHYFDDESVANHIVDQLNNLNCGAQVSLEGHESSQTEVVWQPKPIANAILAALTAEAEAKGQTPPTINDVIYFNPPYGSKIVDRRFAERVEHVTTKPFYVVKVVLTDAAVKYQGKVEKILYQNKLAGTTETKAVTKTRAESA